MTPNQKAFLSMIAASEGTSTNPATKNDGYDVIVTGIDGKPEIFTDYSDHPFANGRQPKSINSTGLKSSASGRYQILLRWWEGYKKGLGLKDFSPPNQDIYALNILKERGAIAAIEAGDLPLAVALCDDEWASFPDADYGQYEQKAAFLQKAFLDAGGVIA